MTPQPKPLDIESIEKAREIFCLQCGPEGLCYSCNDLEQNYIIALKARVKELEAKEIQPLKIDIVWGSEKASVTVTTNQIVNACYPAAFMENEIIKLFRLVVPKPFKRENIPMGPTKGETQI